MTHQTLTLSVRIRMHPSDAPGAVASLIENARHRLGRASIERDSTAGTYSVVAVEVVDGPIEADSRGKDGISMVGTGVDASGVLDALLCGTDRTGKATSDAVREYFAGESR